MLALVALSFFAILTRKLRWSREVAFIILPAVVHFAIAMGAGMDIDARHVLPVYAMVNKVDACSTGIRPQP